MPCLPSQLADVRDHLLHQRFALFSLLNHCSHLFQVDDRQVLGGIALRQLRTFSNVCNSLSLSLADERTHSGNFKLSGFAQTLVKDAMGAANLSSTVFAKLALAAKAFSCCLFNRVAFRDSAASTGAPRDGFPPPFLASALESFLRAFLPFLFLFL